MLVNPVNQQFPTVKTVNI